MRTKITMFLKLAFLFMFAASCNASWSQEEIEKIRTMYKYDECFHVPVDADNLLNFEESIGYELFDISLISSKYQEKAKDVLKYLSEFVKENINGLNIKAIDDYALLEKPLQKVLDTYKYCMRVIVGYKWNVVYVQPKMIAENEVITLKYYEKYSKKYGGGTVWWDRYYFTELWGEPKPFYDEGRLVNRSLDQDWWFYESTLKLVVVHKIKDINGNYYGELELDFYKIDDYDKYFTVNGMPKKEAAEEFYQDQKNRYFAWIDAKQKKQ